ncbi:Uma2 family endonuclease [Saccharothrix deserti]|uniref:Uma2 family endonuclease n=1 Tax=Saccharothrix deserti TaxID=2593674 RepID=UPI00131E086A|nr:Uma2 family endonuclease [Saccharothrix deserti]
MITDNRHEHSILDHHGPWTLDDVMALPEETFQRVELIDGSLLVSPRGADPHQRALRCVAMALRRACPVGLEALPGVNVLLSRSRMLVPDFTVNVAGEDRRLLPVADLVLAGEVLEPSTRLRDLLVKRSLYAEAGVPFYLVVDPKEAGTTATLFQLDGAGYIEAAHSEGGVLALERPFPVTIELSV